MDSATCFHLFAKSKIIMALVKDCLLAAGGKMGPAGELLFPLHCKAVAASGNTEQWLSVQIHNAGDRDLQIKNSPTPCPTAVNSSETQFRSPEYYSSLQSDLLGASVLFASRMPSTIHVVDRILPVLPREAGIVVVAGQQTAGKGRSGNVWESPVGCAMFSFPVVIPLQSKLGQKLSFVQHLVATACVLAVRNCPEYKDIDLRIKWPNDILTSDKVKVGGILVTSSIFHQQAACNIGVGFNVSNSEPSICLNDLIRKYNMANSVDLPVFTTERFISRMLTELERLLILFAAHGSVAFLPKYMEYWLHMNQAVSVRADPSLNIPETTGKIVGLDPHGFLEVKTSKGELWSVQSDGNRFDMMANLLLLNRIS